MTIVETVKYILPPLGDHAEVHLVGNVLSLLTNNVQIDIIRYRAFTVTTIWILMHLRDIDYLLCCLHQHDRITQSHSLNALYLEMWIAVCSTCHDEQRHDVAAGDSCAVLVHVEHPRSTSPDKVH